jgi:hypothetical protein
MRELVVFLMVITIGTISLLIGEPIPFTISFVGGLLYLIKTKKKGERRFSKDIRDTHSW